MESDTTPEEPWVALDAAQAQVVRQNLAPWSPWRALRLQAWAGLVCVLVWWLATGSVQTAWSAAYGMLAVLAPGAMFAWAVGRLSATRQAALALMGFWVWEGVKLVLTLGMLLAAAWLPQAHWWALLATFVVTLKAYGVALWWQTRRVGNK